MLSRLSCLILLALTTPLHAELAQFGFDLKDAEGETLVSFSATDPGFEITAFEADVIELKADAWTFRWAGRFEDADASMNTSMIAAETFLAFEHPEQGAVICHPSDGEAPNTWTRSLNREALKSGFLNFEIVGCADADGAEVTVPGLPFAVGAQYMFEK